MYPLLSLFIQFVNVFLHVIMTPIKIYYQNVRGLRTKTNMFYRNLRLNSFDILCLTETWLMEGISDSELFDDRYLVWRRDRDYSSTGQAMGGGVILAVNRELVASASAEWNSSAEDLWVTVTLQQKKPRITCKIHLCVAYICAQNLGNSLTTQLSNFADNLVDIVLRNPADKYVILGDFNQPNVVWLPADDGYSLYPNNLQGIAQSNLIDNFNICNLLQYNCHANTNGRILDLVLSNNEVTVNSCDDPLVPEDPHHRALCVTADFLQLHHSLPTRPYVKSLYNLADYDSIRKEIDSIDWQHECNSRSLEDAVAYFYGVINRVHDAYIPTKSINQKIKHPPWYKSPLVKLLKEKAKSHAKFKKYGNLSDFQSFVILRQRAKILEKDMFDNYIAKIETDIRDNPRAFWRYVKSKKQSNTYPSILQYDQVSSSNGDEICNMFGEYFHSNFLTNPSTNSPLQPHIGDETDGCLADIGFVEICEEEIFKLLKQLDLSKSAGPDSVSPVFARNCAKSLTLPLSILFKRSLSTGVVPTIWKSAYITPIHKKGSKTCVENYRPISKLCVFAKILEKIVYRQVYSALKQSFGEQQHGFLRGRSTTTNLIICSDFLSEFMSQRSQVDVIYTDYSKCFDRIDHDILSRKLLSMGIRGNLYRWFTSYVENRCQTVVLNGYSSRAISIPSGVPQGSLLGPLLFNIFINDVTSCFKHSKIILYADDMKVMKQVSTSEDALLLQEDLNNFQNYCLINKLDLNVSKCYVCTFTRKSNPINFDYKFLNTQITRVNSIRDLGVTFDSKLIFDTHIDNIVKKASKALGFILRISSEFRRVKTIKILYCSFVRSLLEYASQVWNPNYNIYIDRLEGIQRKFMRFIQFRSKLYLPNYATRCKKFHILPLYERRKIADLAFLFRIMNGSADIPQLVGKVGMRVPSTSLRKFNLLFTPAARTSYRQNSYLLRASRTYNATCQEVDMDIHTTKVSQLKRSLCNYFFANVV